MINLKEAIAARIEWVVGGEVRDITVATSYVSSAAMKDISYVAFTRKGELLEGFEQNSLRSELHLEASLCLLCWEQKTLGVGWVKKDQNFHFTLYLYNQCHDLFTEKSTCSTF